MRPRTSADPKVDDLSCHTSGTEYTGHSENEFITMKQFVLNLKMYTAVLVEMAAVKSQ